MSISGYILVNTYPSIIMLISRVKLAVHLIIIYGDASNVRSFLFVISSTDLFSCILEVVPSHLQQGQQGNR